MKWKALKDNGQRLITQFIVEPWAVGKKSWIKIGEVDSKVTKFSTRVERERLPVSYPGCQFRRSKLTPGDKRKCLQETLLVSEIAHWGPQGPVWGPSDGEKC